MGEATRFDGVVEALGRWTAARTTRRSFLGRAGKVGVLVASGPAIATLLADDAEARVCGQSGVSPKCANFDCDEVWGWCWYANGCCAGGLLKKICDCCGYHYPNVHGYCPGDHNVKCIVESCGTDPRLQVVTLVRVTNETPADAAARIRQQRFPLGEEVAVIAHDAPLVAAVAGPVAAVLGAPFFAIPAGDLPGNVVSDLRALGAYQVKVVGAALPPSVDQALTANGFQVERVGTSGDIGAFSVEVASWIRRVNGATRAVCVGDTGTGWEISPIAGNLAGALGRPLVIGTAAAAAVGVPTLFVGPEVANGPSVVAGSERTASSDLYGLAIELADRGLGALALDGRTVVLTARSTASLPGLAAAGAPIILHLPGSLDGARDWLFGRQQVWGRADRCYLVGPGAYGGLDNEGYRETQSILNGYEIHKLIGVSGQGLPVIPQPVDERPIGRARVAAFPDGQAPDEPRYWTARAPAPEG